MDVVYGFPTPEMWKKAENGEVALGGCCIGGERYACGRCGARW